METNKQKGLQILYFLEDRGIEVDYSDWGDIFYYTFKTELDFNNAYFLLRAYCGPQAIKDFDSNRLEISIDLTAAWTKLKESLEEEDEDFITEQLLESDLVEDDLEDIIRDTFEENENEETKIHLFEPNDEKDPEMWIEEFDDDKIDFNKLIVYPYDEQNPNKPVVSFMVSGGMNGSGEWVNYLDDLQKIFEKLKETTGLNPLIYKEDTDILDDVWTAYILMYNDEKEIESEHPLDEDLFRPHISYIFKPYDTITTPSDFEGDGFLGNCLYEIVPDEETDDLYKVIYTNLDYPNVSGGQGDLNELFEPTDNLEQLSNEIFDYESKITLDMINRDDPEEIYSSDDINENLNEDIVDETYSKDELDSFRNKIFNQQKVMSIYRKKKYGKKRLMCRTKCTNCGREKKLFLSNLVTNPEKYGSCICSDKNIDARYNTITDLYKGKKLLRNNTSGYTGVSWVAKYGGEPYNKWRAYIDVDGQRNYLGDFSSKSKAIRARKAAAAKGLSWYQNNKNEFMATSRRNRRRKRRAKLKKTAD